MLLAAPLLIGCDMTQMDDFTLALLTNDEVLAVSQDPLGKQARRIAKDGSREVWARPLVDGTMAVGLFNRGTEPATVKVTWSQLKLAGPQPVRDLWQQRRGPVRRGLRGHRPAPRHGAGESGEGVGGHQRRTLRLGSEDARGIGPRHGAFRPDRTRPWRVFAAIPARHDFRFASDQRLGAAVEG